MRSLFSLSEMMDSEKRYQKACKEIINRRIQTLIESMGLQLPPNPSYDAYCGLIDFEFWARKDVVGRGALRAKVEPQRSASCSIWHGLVSMISLFDLNQDSTSGVECA
jgi:hypothetical protein